MSDTRTHILDLAERLIRQRGYHAVSFRDLSDALGIKSASIHYHFRRKEDLGVAVVDRYVERIGAQMGAPDAHSWPGALAQFCGVYQDALRQSDLQCLCGLLAAEGPGLPCNVGDRVAGFFRRNLAWLEAAMPPGTKDIPLLAQRIQSQVQGAMTVSVSLGDPSFLDRAVAQLQSDLGGLAAGRPKIV